MALKLTIASDLHLEWGDYSITNTGDSDVLVLAGDILVAQYLHDHAPNTITHSVDRSFTKRENLAKRFRTFLANCSEQYGTVIYVAGNHEYYHGEITESLNHLRQETVRYGNIHLLENEVLNIQDYTFIGCTLWTDLNRGDPSTEFAVWKGINDYRFIAKNKNGDKLTPHDTLTIHRHSLDFIRSTVEDNPTQKYVVVGHMAPSTLSIHHSHINNTLLNGAYVSGCENFIFDHPQIKLWIHGHTHHAFDYTINETRIVCSPRGYAEHEPQAKNYIPAIIEI